MRFSSPILLRNSHLLILLCLRSAAIIWPGLLGIPFGQLRGNRGQVAKQAPGAVVRSGGEVHLRGGRGGGIVVSGGEVSWAECPDAIDGQRLAAGILEKSIKLSGGEIIGGDESTRLGVSATGELADEQVVAETPEIEPSQSHAPRSIEPITAFETLQELASGSINVHEA